MTQRRDNIKPELNADYSVHLQCHSQIFLFGDEPDLSKQLKDLAEATKVSKKISKNSESKQDSYRGQNYSHKSYKNNRGRKFGYIYSQNKQLNSKRPSFSTHKQKEEGKKHK